MNSIDKTKAITAEDLIRRYNLNGLSKDRKIISTINDGLTKVNTIITDYVKIVSSYANDQVDNLITTWFFNGIPTTENEPFASFLDAEPKIGDLYYDKETGNVYQLAKDNDLFQWNLIDDELLKQSLAFANSSVDTADGKRNLFTNTPMPPYEVGDVWYQNNVIKRCRITRTEGNFNELDWCLQNDYSDDYVLSDITAVLNQFQITVESDYATKVLLETTTDEIKGSVEAVTIKTEILENELTNKADVINVEKLTQRVDTVQTSTSQNTTAIEELKVNDQVQSQKITEFEITVGGVSSTISDQNDKISKIIQTVEELNSKISDEMEFTETKESLIAKVEFEKINQSEPIRIVIRPISENISYLYPRNNLFPSDDLFSTTRTLRFKNITTGEIFDLVLPDNLLYYDSNSYDEFILDYGGLSCIINKKVGYNADGTTYVLDNPTTIEYEYIHKNLTDGDYSVYLVGYDTAYLSVQLMTQNIYTTQFATKAEVNSEISQTSNEINAKVSLKLDEEDFTHANIVLKINDNTSSATIEADKINISGMITAINNNTSTTIDGDKITTGSITASQVNSSIITTSNFSAQKINANQITSGKISTSLLNSDVITTSNFSSQKINASQITSGTISTSILSSDVITTSNLSAQNINANQIKSGILDASSVTVTNLNASNITSGTLSSSSINLGSGKFSVSTAGYLTSTSGKIGGWTIRSGSLYASSGGYEVELTPGYLNARASGDTWESVRWYSLAVTYSDKKTKMNINELEEKYNYFYDKLKPVTFKYKDEYEPRKLNSSHIGFVAQDIQKAQEESGINNIAMLYGEKLLKLDKQEIIALNTWQIQKLKKEIKELKEKFERTLKYE